MIKYIQGERGINDTQPKNFLHFAAGVLFAK